MTKREIKIATKNGTLATLYEQEVNKLIRVRYTISNELAVLRQRDTKPSEFATYNEYVELCKQKVKASITSLGGTI